VRGARQTLGVAAAVLVVAACGSNASPPPAASSFPALLTPTTSPTGSSPASAPPATSGASPIPTDDALLDLLPAKLDGLNRQVDPSVDASIAADPDLARLARSFATALYIDPSTSEFAYASVVRLRRELSADESRSYRDSFDAAACSQAGGLARTAEAAIGGHQTFIGTCAGGVRTYHVELDDGAMILSMSEAGDRRLAELLIGGLE
jgi:hypothetical protein